MSTFTKEFHTLNYAIKESSSILLVAHSSPDGDTAGSCFALKEYIKNLGKDADVTCFDPMPSFLAPIIEDSFILPDEAEFSKYKLIIACDSIERGFPKMRDRIGENQVIALIDHHPNIILSEDINIIDPKFSSVCEIVYEFFVSEKIEISRRMASLLMLGILSDTGMFQHSTTTPHLLNIASILMKKGAPIAKIVETALTNKNISTLKLWGKAFGKAKISSKNGMISSVLTRQDLEECNASTEDISQVASILNTVPGTKFSLILSEREGDIIKGSLRSEAYKEVDVSQIAAKFGGGGHKLASGFEIKGKIIETETGWKIV